jgi:hypothetical protein
MTAPAAALPTEQTAEKLSDLFQTAYNELEAVAGELPRETDDPLSAPIGLEDIGALAIVCDRIDVDLDQCGKMLESMRNSMVTLIVMRAQQEYEERTRSDASGYLVASVVCFGRGGRAVECRSLSTQLGSEQPYRS